MIFDMRIHKIRHYKLQNYVIICFLFKLSLSRGNQRSAAIVRDKKSEDCSGPPFVYVQYIYIICANTAIYIQNSDTE